MDKQIFILEKYSSEKRRENWVPALEKFSSDFSFSQFSEHDQIIQIVNSLPGAAYFPFIIFAHESDLIRVEKGGELVEFCNSKQIPLVMYSGGSISGYKLTEGVLENLNIDTLFENLEDFLTAVKGYDSISVEDLDRLVNIDPELETLLEPFATLDPFNSTLPFAKDSSNNEIRDDNGNKRTIKDMLADYVQQKIDKL